MCARHDGGNVNMHYIIIICGVRLVTVCDFRLIAKLKVLPHPKRQKIQNSLEGGN